MTTRAGSWLTALLVWCGAFFGFVTVAHGNLESTDAALSMHAARVLWLRGDSALLTAEQGGDLLGERLGADRIHEAARNGAQELGKVGANGRAYVWFPVGYVWLLVPFAAAGEGLARAWPEGERAFRAKVAPGAGDEQLHFHLSYVFGHPVLTQGLIALLMPAAFAATSLLLAFAIARALGAGPRDAAIGTAAMLLATQMFALGRETLSDGPGLCCMLAVLLAVVRAHRGDCRPRTMLLGGVAAGCAVLLRYQNALLVAAMSVVVLLACRRERRTAAAGWFAAGGAPFLAALLAVNHARFGSPFDTGYPSYGTWFDQPVWLGTTKLLFAAGRGILWLSPLLWLALPLAATRRNVRELKWLAWVVFLVPIVLFAGARGWQGGQCWGARYVTPAVVLLLAIVLPQGKPWLAWPRTWTVLLACGMFVNLTSLVAPTRGQIQLASQAARAAAAAEVPPVALSEDDIADRISWHARYSPLHANWSYAVHSRVGGFETEDGRPDDHSDRTIEPLFGVAAVAPEQGWAPRCWEDRCGRHLWWQFWGELTGVSPAVLFLPPLLLAIVCSAFGWRRVLSGQTASDSSTPR